MKVYAVLSGEKHEGSYLENVYRSKEDARAGALQVECGFDGGWTEVCDGFWENGCNFVCIVERKVL